MRIPSPSVIARRLLRPRASLRAAWHRVDRDGRRQVHTRETLEARAILPTVIDALPAGSLPAADGWAVRATAVTAGPTSLLMIGPPRLPHPTIVVKSSVAEARRSGIRRERRVLSVVHRRAELATVAAISPRPLACADVGDRRYLATNHIAGDRGTAVGPSDQLRLLSPAAEAIAALHAGTTRTVTIDRALADHWISSPARRIGDVLRRETDTRLRQRLATISADLSAALLGRTMEVSWIHGDFWLGNVIVARHRIVGIIDWDSVRPRELPIHDLLHLVLTARRQRHEVPWGLVLRDLMAARDLLPEERAALGPLADADPAEFRRLVLLYWMGTVASSIRRHPDATTRETWIARNIETVLGPSR